MTSFSVLLFGGWIMMLDGAYWTEVSCKPLCGFFVFGQSKNDLLILREGRTCLIRRIIALINLCLSVRVCCREGPTSSQHSQRSEWFHSSPVLIQ